MSDVVSLELTLDDALDEAVRAEWGALAAAGLPSLAHHTGASNRPHITLLVRPALGEFDATGLVALLPLPVVLGAPILFGRGPRRVLARSVVVDAALLELHAAVHVRAGAGDDLPHTLPGAWTPHVTLAHRIGLDDLPRALAVVGDELRGTAIGLRRWDAATKTVTALVPRSVPPDALSPPGGTVPA